MQKPVLSLASCPAANTLRVLVIDDNADAADAMAMVVELLGHECRTIGEGKKALSAAQAFKPHVALIDISLPDISGHAVARQLRAVPVADVCSRPPLHLIAVTGWSSDADQLRSREAGFDQHLTKPLDMDALESLLADLAGLQSQKSNSRAAPPSGALATAAAQ